MAPMNSGPSQSRRAQDAYRALWFQRTPYLHLASVLKPLTERFDLLRSVGREQMFDCHVRRRDENRFRVRESIETGLTVVVADARESDASERHGFNEQMNVHLVDRATAERQAREEVVDRLLVTAEKETGKRFWTLLH